MKRPWHERQGLFIWYSPYFYSLIKQKNVPKAP
jgi:hypothetical protein